MKKTILLISAFLTVLFFFGVQEVWAVASNSLGNFPGQDLSFLDITRIFTGLACWLGRIATIGAVIFVILAGLRFVTARDSAEAFKNAVTNFKHVLWGILVIYGVYVIIATVANAVGITDFSFIPLKC